MSSKPIPLTERLLSLAEVAQRAGVGLDTARAWVRSGELAATDCSAKRNSKKPRWRVSPADLAVFEQLRGNQGDRPKSKPRRKPSMEGVTQYF